MTLFLTIASTYDAVYIALFKDNTVVESIHEHKFEASKNLIVACNRLLNNNNLTLSDLTFIAVNQGPGPFTTLRTVITYANGISFASSIPLIGINSLHALLQEYADPAYPQTIVLLNAFGNDVYWATSHIIGCSAITAVLEQAENTYPQQTIRFIGNGAALYRQLIERQHAARAFFPSPIPEHCSVEQIGIMALEKWKNKQDISQQLLPLYLKDLSFAQ